MEKTIVIRSKNASKFDETAVKAIRKILDAEDKNIVFFSCYSPEQAARTLGLNYTGEKAKAFANELRYQFSKFFPELPYEFEFSTENIFKSEESPAFETLESKLTTFVAHRILETIIAYSYYPIDSIERAGFLLRASVAQNDKIEKAKQLSFGGICEIFKSILNIICHPNIGDSKKIAEWLNPYSAEISALFDEIMHLKFQNYNQPEVKLHSEVDEEATLPDNSKQENEILVCASYELSNNSMNTEEPKTKTLSSTMVLDNQNLIENYFDVVEKLENVGLSTEMLNRKKDKIISLIKASKQFNDFLYD